jgi:hypothetical protein
VLLPGIRVRIALQPLQSSANRDLPSFRPDVVGTVLGVSTNRLTTGGTSEFTITTTDQHVPNLLHSKGSSGKSE